MATTKKRVTKPAAKATKATATPRKRAAASKTAAPVSQVDTAAATVTTPSDETPDWLTAVRAAESKKAIDVRVLDLREVTAFADYFVICSGTNPRQVQAIAEEIDVQLSKHGAKATSLEGFKNGEWVLADYGDMIVHVFSPQAREFYDLERLWRHAKSVEIPAE